MPRPSTRPHNPLLECEKCSEPVIKTAEQEFACIDCGWQPDKSA